MAKVTQAQKNWLLSGERLRNLRKEQNLTLEELACKLPEDRRGRQRSEKTIGRMERGECQISGEYALMLSRALGCRPEYLLLEDDFKTGNDQLSYSLDKMEENAKVLHSLINDIAANYNYTIKYLRAEDAPNGITLCEDCYSVVENGSVIACISLSEYCQLRAEIAHYSAYLFGTLLNKAKNRLPTAFEYPGGGKTNG